MLSSYERERAERIAANKRKLDDIFGGRASTSRGKAVVGTWNTQRVGFAARSVLWDASASSRAKRAARWRPNAAFVVEVKESERARADCSAWKPWYTRFDAEQFAADLHAKRKLRDTSKVLRLPRANRKWRWETSRDVDVYCLREGGGRRFVCAIRRNVAIDLPPYPLTLDQTRQVRPPLKRGEGVRSVETAFISHAGSARVRIGRTELATFENRASGGVAASYDAWVSSYFSKFIAVADASADAGALADGAAATSWGFACETHVDDDDDVDANTAMAVQHGDVVVEGGEMVFPSLSLVCALGDGDMIVWNARDWPHSTAESRVRTSGESGQPNASVGTRAGTVPTSFNNARHCLWQNGRSGRVMREVGY
ncbi:hypothetical protein RI054_30g121470 [Pseudoscourfieldia marina]